MSVQPEPVGLYLHLPFCRVRCSYCAFAVSTDLRLERAYQAAILDEIRLRADRRRADTVFWGGGTPSRSSFPSISSIDAALREAFDVDTDAETTIEANPEDVDAEAIERWKTIGINRLSLGVQSFHDRELIPLGRIHGATRALRAVETAVDSGLRVSIDLMLGLPGQTRLTFRETLRIAIDSGVGHISAYMLDLEEGSALVSRLDRDLMTVPDDGETSATYLEMVETLSSAGLAQDEGSNFARPGEVSLHNLRYWERRPYYGFGAGAHSFAGERRTGNVRNVRGYIEAMNRGGPATELVDELGETELRRELIFLSLRRARGIVYSDLVAWTGEKGGMWIEQGLKYGWLKRGEDRVAFTPEGFLLSNDLLSELF
jgi:putative oxygen-independent coproporphyrinogen III oxidase